MRPVDFDEESAVSVVYQLCMYSQRKLSVQLRELPPNVCMQLLFLLRSRRVRVSASESVKPLFPPSQLAMNLFPIVKPSSNRLRTILPAPTADGSHLTLMESLLKEAYEEQQAPQSTPAKKQLVMPVMPLKPFRFIKAKEPYVEFLKSSVVEINKASTVPLTPPRKLSKWVLVHFIFVKFAQWIT